MRTILFIIQKEFLQIFRHKIMLPIIFAMPLIQLIILAFAADYEIRNINLHVIDRDLSQASQRLISKFEASPNFIIVNSSFTPKEAMKDIKSDKADLFVEIPTHFERELIKENNATIQISVNAINGMKAGLAFGYANNILMSYQQEVRSEWTGIADLSKMPLEVEYSNWYNPDMEYDNFMVPGILVVLVTMIGMFLSGMNIVKEKEIGTIEQINVTPIRKYQFVIGKLLPFWIIALFELAFGLTLGKLIFDIPILGNLFLVFGFASVYLFVVLGLGLFVSTITETQQQAMFVAWFLAIIFILMSGLFTPIQAMPEWAQYLTNFNPIAYFIDFMRMVLLKGSGFGDVSRHFFTLLGAGVLVNVLAIMNYRKTTA